MTEKCECCGEGKDPANPNGLDWETLCAQTTWQCNDCEQWNDKADIYKVPPLNELLNHPVFDAELSEARAALHVLLEKEQDQ